MKTAKNVQLNGREFGAGVVAAPALERWLQAQDLPGLAILLPNFESPAFVQVEHLLCAIEGARFTDMTEAEARALVPHSALAAIADSQGLCAEELQGLEHWLAGAVVHSDLRDRFRIAFSTGTLQLLDGFTLAPKVSAASQHSETLEPLSAAGLPAETPDDDKLATREALIRAFGSFTGMDAAWFDNITDKPRLLAARKWVGQGGRGHIMEPWFCPYEVMLWQIDPKKKKGRQMSPATGWRMLKVHFTKAYADHEHEDPSAD